MDWGVIGLQKFLWSDNVIKIFFKKNSENRDYLRGIFLIKKFLDIRDHYTYHHSINVSRYAYLLGREVGMDQEGLKELVISGLLHDIGKAKVPLNILLKPGRLDNHEYELIKKHVQFGADIVSSYSQFRHLRENILYHHERYDGLGYPSGLHGDNIPLASRIIGLADSFDAMTTDRPYKGGVSLEHALRELVDNANSQYDASLVKRFINLVLRWECNKNSHGYDQKVF